EAGELGTAPLTGEALAGLGMTEARWGASARRGVQRLLAHGVVAVAGPLRRPAVVDAVQRAGLGVRPPAEDPGDAAGPDPLAGRSLARVTAPPPAVGEGPATFAVFDVPDEAALTARGAATCVATVLAGRLVHRRRSAAGCRGAAGPGLPQWARDPRIPGQAAARSRLDVRRRGGTVRPDQRRAVPRPGPPMAQGGRPGRRR